MNSRRIDIRETKRGPYRVWEAPIPGADYVLGADISLTKRVGIDTSPRRGRHGDDSAFVILRRARFKLIQVAETRVQVDAGHFGEIISAWGARYNHALINIEKNLAHAPFTALRRTGYPLDRLYTRPNETSVNGTISLEYFFHKNASSQKFLIDTTIDALSSGYLDLRSADLLSELRTLQKDDRGQINTRSKDLSIALMMAVIADATTEQAPLAEEEKPPPKAPQWGMDRTLWNERNAAAQKPTQDKDEISLWGASDGPPEWEDMDMQVGPQGAD